MDRNKLLQENITRVKTAYEGNIPDRVPTVLSLHPSYIAQYYGYSVKELYTTKPELVSEMYYKAIDEFGFDALSAITNAKPILATEPLGGGHFTLHDTGMQASNHGANTMSGSEEEYNLIGKNFYEFCRDIVLPKKFSKITGNNNETFAALKESYEKFTWFMSIAKKTSNEIEQYGCPIMFPYGNMIHPIDLIMDFFRDIPGMIIDMRRKPDLVKETAKSLEIQLMQDFVKFPASDQGKGTMWPLHLAPYLKPKDFYEFYWPYMKSMLEGMINHGIYVWVYMENNWEPHLDALQDLPDNNRLVGFIEYCDYKKFKQKVGKKMSVSGGLPVNLLAYGSNQECEDYTKKLIDDCAGGGGFILDSDKLMINRTDAKPENIKTVINVAREYGKY